MKIIYKGVPNLWWYGRQITCTVCNSIIQVEKDEDLKPEYIFDQNKIIVERGKILAKAKTAKDFFKRYIFSRTLQKALF